MDESGTTTHDPHHQPLPSRRGGSPEFAALYRFDFWKMDLGAFTGRGQGGPCLTDAARSQRSPVGPGRDGWVCARAAIGHAAAMRPTVTMNSRRRMQIAM